MDSLFAKRAARRCASRILKFGASPIALAILTVTMTMPAASAQENLDAKPQRYRVVVLPLDGAADSYLGGYLFYASLNHRGTIGFVTYDPSKRTFLLDMNYGKYDSHSGNPHRYSNREQQFAEFLRR